VPKTRKAARNNAAPVGLEATLWAAADQFRANSGLKSQEYSGPTLGLIFLRFAERVRRRRLHGYELCSECIRP